MSQLGITVFTNEAPLQGGVSSSTGTAFMVGITDQGPTGSATLIQSLSSYISTYGTRSTASSALYDAVQTFFAEQGEQVYISREVGTAMAATPASYTASLTLNDAVPHPTVVATYNTPGVDGNNYEIAVTLSTAATFTATTATSTALTAISSFANIGVGSKITGTGIAANTYIVSVNTGASSAVLSAATTASASGVTITPATFTVTVQDLSANVLETWGPFNNTADLFAVVSGFVTFTQSAGGGFTNHIPTTLTATALSGGADDTGDIGDAQVTTALTLFTAPFGPGQVSAPGQTDATVHAALATHAQAFNRYAVLDTADNATVATVLSALGAIVDPSYCIITEGSGIIPGLTTGTTRTVASSAIVSALCAQVDSTGNPNQAPAGPNWPLQYVTGFTENFTIGDIQTLNNAGVNSFTTINGVLCLFGFSAPMLQASDPIFWQASHGRLRMALVDRFKNTAAPFMFQQIDGRGKLLAAFGQALANELDSLYRANALFGSTADQAYGVNVGPTVNPVANLAQGIIAAAVSIHMSPFTEQVTITLSSVPVTQSL